MKKGLSFFLCLFLMVFLVLAPMLIGDGIGKNIYRLKKEKQEDAFRGTLEFWHVVSFKTPVGSGYEYLKQHCIRFERNTPYVFVDLKGMTVEEAKRRMNEGEYPDLISYPAGTFDENKMTSLEKPVNIIPCLSDVSEKSVPYMMDSYVMVTNRSLMRELGVQKGFGVELSREMYGDAYRKLSDAGMIPISATETIGLDPCNIAQNMMLVSDESYITEVSLPELIKVEIGRDIFLKGQSGMYLCPYSEYLLMKKEGLGFDIEGYPASDHTDAVQMMGVYKSADPRKEDMSVQLAEGFFTDNMQRKLENILMLPCMVIEGIYESDADRQEIYGRICEKGMKS